MSIFNNTALAGRCALVTGASRGIGKDIAAQLVAAGAYVIGTATSDNGATAISEAMGDSGHGAVLNTSDPESVSALIAGVKDKSPDILINNAGITRDNLLMRMKDDEWNAVIATNLTGVFQLTKGLLRPMMKKRFGRVISVGSVVGTLGNPGQANYAAAKAGLIGFTKSLARELGGRGITANVIAPGFIQTDMTDALNEEQQQAMLSQVPLGTLGQTTDIAHMAVFLASDAAGYITGETLHVNGGMLMP